jgi:hypothetical protein
MNDFAVIVVFAALCALWTAGLVWIVASHERTTQLLIRENRAERRRR